MNKNKQDVVGKPFIPVEIKKKVGDKFKFRPMSKRVLIRIVNEDILTPAGIIIPGNTKEKTTANFAPRAKIIRCAEGYELGFKPGDLICYEPASNSAIYHPDFILGKDEYYVTHELNIMGVIE